MKRNRLLLIADSGSTKTDWALVRKPLHFRGKALALSDKSAGASESAVQRFRTEGLNPFYQSEAEMADALRAVHSHLQALLPEAEEAGSELEIHFYGAGCTPEKAPLVEHALTEAFGAEEADTIEVKGDLLAAARALCGHRSGIACILGTGSNSCVYDGETIRENVSPLGFILGDEGSGAVLGKLLVGSLLKGQLGPELRDEFLQSYGLSPADVVEHVYRRPFPNRFLAGFAPFLSARLHRPEIRAFCREAFAAFFRRNVMQYPEALPHEKDGSEALTVHFTGSVAYHFRSIIRPLAEELGLKPGQFTLSPIEGLIAYHNTDE